LWTLRQQELSHTIFPVGHLEKSEVRVLAKKFKLPVADKKDSQGICFLGEVDMKEFLSHYIITKTGAVLNELGEKIGIHNGAIFYTIGERHGFVITEKSPTDSPYYVISKDVIANTITVSPVLANVEIGIRSTKIGNTSWVWQKAEQGDVLGVRIRYRQEKQGCEIGAKGEITFVDSQIGVSAGQSLVFYRGEECLGGGIIEPLV
jgi:tRNA-specific 2-thiouridylase